MGQSRSYNKFSLIPHDFTSNLDYITILQFDDSVVIGGDMVDMKLMLYIIIK